MAASGQCSSSSVAGSSTSGAGGSRYGDHKKRLRDLHARRNEARKMNHLEVVEEDRRNKLPANWEARKRRAEWELEDQRRRGEAEARGDDYERVKLLDTAADEAGRADRARRKRALHADTGFSSFEDATARQYERLTRSLKPDMAAYEREKALLGPAAFYPTTSTIVHGLRRDTTEGVTRMVEDLEKQIKKRGKFSRRRTYDPDADIDFINERNMRFNQKIDRFYGKYTTEIKQNLERGTAV